jgi:Transposase DDE domain
VGAPVRETLARLPLAQAVLTLWRWVADANALNQIFEDHRGRCYEKILAFSTLVYLIRDALLEYGGSGRKSFEEAKGRGELPASFRAAYGKLGRIPIPVSAAFLAECTARLQEVYPQEPQAQAVLPPSLDPYQILIFDGKAIKRVAKRLKPLWDTAGGLLGGRALVAMNLRSGLAVAMRAHPDGDANEVRFVGDLVPEVRQLTPGKRLWVADSGFCDLTQPARFAEQGDAFVIRYHPKVPFYADPACPARTGHDNRGRQYVEDWGWLGSPRNPKRRLSVRRITVHRPGEKDVTVVTNLRDADAIPAVDLLEVYLNRGGIERMFQQVTEVFGLEHLIGTKPQGVIFQLAMCLVLYNLIQVVRGVIAAEVQRPREAISAEKLFEDVQRQMIAWSETVEPEATIAHFAGEWTAVRVKVRLSELLEGVWKDRWWKSPPKKPQAPRKKVRKRTHGSVYRVLEAHQQRLKKEKRQVRLA